MTMIRRMTTILSRTCAHHHTYLIRQCQGAQALLGGLRRTYKDELTKTDWQRRTDKDGLTKTVWQKQFDKDRWTKTEWLRHTDWDRQTELKVTLFWRRIVGLCWRKSKIRKKDFFLLESFFQPWWIEKAYLTQGGIRDRFPFLLFHSSLDQGLRSFLQW